MVDQVRLEERYIAAAAAANLARQDHLGRPGAAASQAPGWSQVCLASLYEGATAFLSSASRSPLANAVITRLQPRRGGHGELDDHLAPILLGSAAAGLGAYMAGVLLVSVDRQARHRQWPRLSPVDLSVLLPDPLPVRLNLLPDGSKHYDEPDPALMHQRRLEVADQRERLEAWRAALAGRGLVGGQVKPMLTAAINVLRRHAVPHDHLVHAGPVLAESSLASGSAAFIARTASGLARAWPSTVTDFDGQSRPAWLYRSSERATPGVSRGGWSSLGAVSRAALDTLQDAVAQVGMAMRDRQAARFAASDLARHVVGNAVAGLSAQGAGLLAASPLWGSTAPPAGERPDSDANLVRQGMASYVNDLVWDNVKPILGPSGRALAQRLDETRRSQLLRLEAHIGSLTEDLRDELRTWWSDHAATAGDVEGTPALRALAQGEPFARVRVDEALAELTALRARATDAADPWHGQASALGDLAQGWAGLQQALAQEARMQARMQASTPAALQSQLQTQASAQRFPG